METIFGIWGVGLLLLEAIANDQTELTAQQRADLQPVAVQCPFSGGEGVFQARALLDDDTVYDDVAACAAAAPQPLKQPAREGEVRLSFRIYPNPSNGLAILEMEREMEADGHLTISNYLGQTLVDEDLPEGTEAYPLDLTGFPAGVYYVTVADKSGKLTQIFTVSK